MFQSQQLLTNRRSHTKKLVTKRKNIMSKIAHKMSIVDDKIEVCIAYIEKWMLKHKESILLLGKILDATVINIYLKLVRILKIRKSKGWLITQCIIGSCIVLLPMIFGVLLTICNVPGILQVVIIISLLVVCLITFLVTDVFYDEIYSANSYHSALLDMLSRISKDEEDMKIDSNYSERLESLNDIYYAFKESSCDCIGDVFDGAGREIFRKSDNDKGANEVIKLLSLGKLEATTNSYTKMRKQLRKGSKNDRKRTLSLIQADIESDRQAIEDLCSIWKSALMGNSLAASTERENIEKLGRVLGIDVMVDSYLSGVPVDDIIA